jgi:hypothetical protein
LARFDSEQKVAGTHPAEQQVLWSIEAQLERVLSEPLAPNYRELLDEARRRVTGEE